MPKYSSFYCSQSAQSSTPCEDIVFLLPPKPGLYSMMPQPYCTVSPVIACRNTESIVLVPKKQGIPRQGRSIIEKVVHALFCFQSHVFGDIPRRRRGIVLLQPRKGGSTSHLLFRRQGHRARPEKDSEETNSQRCMSIAGGAAPPRLLQVGAVTHTHAPPKWETRKEKGRLETCIVKSIGRGLFFFTGTSGTAKRVFPF